MKKRRKKRRATNPTGKSAPPYPTEFKLRLVRLHLEEGYRAALLKLSQETSTPKQSTIRMVEIPTKEGYILHL